MRKYIQVDEDEENSYIIETEVDGPEECLDIEEYDPEYSVCFIECDSPEQCNDIEKQIDEAFADLWNDYEKFAQDFHEFEEDPKEDEYEKISEVVYKIGKNETFTIATGKENSKHIKVKNWLAKISPNTFSDNYLNRLILYTKDEDTGAFVIPNGKNNKWDIYVNINVLNQDGEKEMIFTLIHEYAHILTLNNSQVSSKNTNCDYEIQEGCVNKKAYLYNFYNKFWKNKIKEDLKEASEKYNKNPKAFVSEYAATNPEEDIAESFASFVFKKKPLGNTIAEQKIMYFLSYSELIKMREAIRNNLKSMVRERIIK